MLKLVAITDPAPILDSDAKYSLQYTGDERISSCNRGCDP